MMIRLLTGVLLVATVSACGSGDDSETEGVAADTSTAGAPQAAAGPMNCQAQGMPIPDRASPFDSTLVTLGDATAKVCYGRPSMNGRVIFGGLVPYDTIWRTGANEPTTIHIPFTAEIAGIHVEPGSYSLYTVPGQENWTVVVNRSVTQWGIESQYTDEIRAQDVGRAQVPAERTSAPVETFVITSEASGPTSADLILDWENTRVRIPITRL